VAPARGGIHRASFSDSEMQLFWVRKSRCQLNVVYLSVERTSHCGRCRDSLRLGKLGRVTPTPIRPSCVDNSKGAVNELMAREVSSE
jgi:hypothetical protein